MNKREQAQQRVIELEKLVSEAKKEQLFEILKEVAEKFDVAEVGVHIINQDDAENGYLVKYIVLDEDGEQDEGLEDEMDEYISMVNTDLEPYRDCDSDQVVIYKKGMSSYEDLQEMEDEDYLNK